MEKAPDDDAGEGGEPLPYKTWILRVSIHCGGCRKKVKKVLQSIEGVYKIEIDSKQHRVVVTGNVESATLIKKLIKSGKNAKLWTEKDPGDDGERRTDGQEKDNGGDSSGEDHTDDKGGGPQAAAAPPGGGGGKKKKKKKKKKGNAAAGPVSAGGAPGLPPAADGPVDPTSVYPPRQQVFSYPQFYYPAPEYGMSYNAAAPTAAVAASHYTLPMYSYTYFRPDCYPTPVQSGSIMDDETGCMIM